MRSVVIMYIVFAGAHSPVVAQNTRCRKGTQKRGGSGCLLVQAY